MEILCSTIFKEGGWFPNVYFLLDKRAKRWDGQGKFWREERDGRKKMPQKNLIWAVEIYRERPEDPAGRDAEFQEKEESQGEFWLESWEKRREEKWLEKGNFVLQGQPGDVGEPGEKVSAGICSRVYSGISSRCWIQSQPWNINR